MHGYTGESHAAVDPRPAAAPGISESHMHSAVDRVGTLVADIEQTVEVLQARLEPVVYHHPSEAADMPGDAKPMFAPLAGEIHGLADRLTAIRNSLAYTLSALEV